MLTKNNFFIKSFFPINLKCLKYKLQEKTKKSNSKFWGPSYPFLPACTHEGHNKKKILHTGDKASFIYLFLLLNAYQKKTFIKSLFPINLRCLQYFKTSYKKKQKNSNSDFQCWSPSSPFLPACTLEGHNFKKNPAYGR